MKILQESVLALGPVSAGGTIDSIQRTEPSRGVGGGGRMNHAVHRGAFVSDEDTFSSSVRMVLDMGTTCSSSGSGGSGSGDSGECGSEEEEERVAEFSLPTASSSGLFSSRWREDASLARWGASTTAAAATAAAGSRSGRRSGSGRNALSERFYGNLLLPLPLLRGLQAVALTLHDVLSLLGLDWLFSGWDGDQALFHDTIDGIFFPLSVR